MVGSEHFVAEELEDTTDAVTLDGGAEVADVHVLGDVGAAEVDQNALFGVFFGLLFGCVSKGDLVCLVDVLDLVFDELLLQMNIEEEASLGGVT